MLGMLAVLCMLAPSQGLFRQLHIACVLATAGIFLPLLAIAQAKQSRVEISVRPPK
jgi:hypothetical protein